MTETNRKLKIFLCHSSQDKPVVRELYQRLNAEGWIEPWLDEENLLPGQDWDLEIEKAVEETDAVLIFLSDNSVSKEGYVQRELRFVLNMADYKPDGTVFVIPIRLEECILPRRLKKWHYLDYFTRQDWAYQRLLLSLQARARKLGISTLNPAEEKAKEERREKEVADRIAREKAAEEKKRIEKSEQEKANALAREISAEKARKEKINRDKKKAEEKKRIEKREKADAVAREKTDSPLPSLRERSSSIDGGEVREVSQEKTASKKKNTPYFIGGGIVILLIITYLIGKASATPAEHFPTEAPATVVLATTISTENPFTPTPTLDIGSTMLSEKDGTVQVYVPAGEFEMGSEQYDDEKPIHTVYLDAYWIDETEVTNEMFVKFVNDTEYVTDAEQEGKSYVYEDGSWTQKSGANWQHPLGIDGSISALMEHPVVHVSWNDASAYCEWADRRLPTEAEWEKAARGGLEGKQYPWGDDTPVCEYGAINGAKFDDNENCNDTGTEPVGSYAPNGYGVYDMSGNVWEWVDDWYAAYPGNTIANSSYGTTYRVLRGGSWSSYEDILRSAYRYDSSPSNSNYFIGFRCSRSP